MSLASLGAFVAAMGWLLIAASLAIVHDAHAPATHPLHLPDLFHWRPSAHADYRPLALAWLLGCVATLAPLLALRRLGKSLWLNPAPSFEAARRFRTLAHALLFNLIGGWVSSALASTQTGHYQAGFGVGDWGTLVAILLAYIVAGLVHEGATAADENRKFV
jgi:hypothetical protein